MRSALPAGLALLSLFLCACQAPIRSAMNRAPAPETVILAGTMEHIPPIRQQTAPCCGAAMYPHLRDKSYLVVSRHLHPVVEGLTRLYTNADWAQIPIEGPFFIELPVSEEWYIRGVSCLTDDGMVFVRFDAQIHAREPGGVVYIGHLRMQRHEPRELFVYDLIDEQRLAVDEQGLGRLHSLPWTTALAVPLDTGPVEPGGIRVMPGGVASASRIE